MKKKEFFFLAAIVLLGVLLRLYKINEPLADWHSWRQADTAAVSRNFVNDGFDLLHPRFDDISNVASGLDNPQGFRFVEFPIYNAMHASLARLFSGFGLEVSGRITSIIASLFSIIFLYLLVKKYLGLRIAIFAAGFFAFLPFNIYYGRTILPDTSMVTAMLGGIYFFDRWLETNTRIKNQTFYLLAILFTASAFLIKPFALFFTLPIFYLAYRRWGIGLIKQPQIWIFALLTVAPLVAWRLWIQQFPEGIPVTAWLFNENNIRFKGAFFYWIFADRVGRLILGYFGIALFIFGLLRKTTNKEGLLFFSFLASSLIYLTVIAGGNVKHDYYQILIIPTVAIFLAKGADFLLSLPREYTSRIASYIALLICCAAMLGFGWYHVRDYFNINNRSIVAAGEAVDRLTAKDALILAPYDGDTSLLYHTKRRGWANFQKSLPEMIVMGADYLVLTNPTPNDFSGLGKEYKIVSSTKEYMLIDLRSPL